MTFQKKSHFYTFYFQLILTMQRLLFILLIISVFSLVQCKKKMQYVKIPSQIDIKEKKSEFSKNELQNWVIYDIINDTIPGISLNRAINTILKGKKGKEVIVAVLDSEVDIKHKGIQDFIWKNPNEIPNNNIDDDKNGYVDDVNGWNFLGGSNGENSNFTNYSYTRILKKNLNFFNGDENKTLNKDSIAYRIYLKAKRKYEKQVIYAKEDIEYADMLLNSLENVTKGLTKYLKEGNQVLKSLDSLKELYPNNEELQDYILIRSNFIKHGYSQNYMNTYKVKAQERVNKLLNLKYDDREIVNDNPEDILDIKYGNKIVNGNLNLFSHGTEIVGTIVSLKNSNVKIMPICISPFGDEHDKDIAVAIKYAVDNGAKVINMSFGKEFSLHKEWVDEAFKYAEKHNVLIISSAGNSSYNLNNQNDYYPNDNMNNGTEISGNFLLVGGISKNLNENFLYKYSNYGNIDVDIFAPAHEIYTTVPNDKYKYDSGTSLASAVTSGVAALIYSYYPNLTAPQVKKIIMDSGLEYNIKVNIPAKRDKNKTIPFNQLSKSGKVLNVYNALLLASKQ